MGIVPGSIRKHKTYVTFRWQINKFWSVLMRYYIEHGFLYFYWPKVKGKAAKPFYIKSYTCDEKTFKQIQDLCWEKWPNYPQK
jgi:hypothetical protein